MWSLAPPAWTPKAPPAITLLSLLCTLKPQPWVIPASIHPEHHRVPDMGEVLPRAQKDPGSRLVAGSLEPVGQGWSGGSLLGFGSAPPDSLFPG